MEELVVMKNLISDIAASCGRISAFSMMGMDISNRDFWQTIPSWMKQEAVKDAEEALKEDFAYLPLSLYKDFSKTGNRKNYETPFFKKRKMLSDLVIAECIENEGRFLDKIEDGIWSILSEPGWAIPAHNTYIRDTPQLPLPLIERPILDLFACETGEILALTRILLKGKIEKELSEDIRFELERRILKPYLDDHFWWMGGEGKLNNWSPWCVQNVLIATLSLETLSEDGRKEIISKAAKTLDLFLDEYADDGCCDEGAQYWHAAALALWGCLFVLSEVSKGKIDRVFDDMKIRAMATYIEKVHVVDDIYINYADCSPKAGKLGAREYLYGKAVKDNGMMAHAIKDWKKYGYKEDDNNYNLFYKALAFFAAREIEEKQEEIKQEEKPSFVHFEKTGIAIYRKDGVVLGVKAGCNDDSHNHNDVGSITLYYKNKPLLIDIGVETYTKTTFSKDRYTLWPMQSAYHNTVNFPPYMQKDGPEFRATEVSYDPKTARMETKEAYDINAGVETCKRSVEFNGLRILVVDEAKAKAMPALTLMSVEKPEAGEHLISYPSFNICFKGDGGIKTEEIEISDKRLRIAWPKKVYRTLVNFKERLEWTIEIKQEETWK